MAKIVFIKSNGGTVEELTLKPNDVLEVDNKTFTIQKVDQVAGTDEYQVFIKSEEEPEEPQEPGEPEQPGQPQVPGNGIEE